MKNSGERIKKRRRVSQLQALRNLRQRIDPLMLLLAIGWLVLLMVELLRGLPPLLEVVSIVIWAIFIFEFIIMMILAPNKMQFLASNWLSAITLIIPAFRILAILRIFRFARLLRVTSGLRVARITGAINRARKSLDRRMAGRRLVYVTAMTAIVAFTGAAGMYALEHNANPGFKTYGESLWWTGMILTSLGSQYWPVTPEGRILGFFISVYTFGVFGYFTAVLASFFIGKDTESHSDDKHSKEPMK